MTSSQRCARCASGRGCGADIRGDDGSPRRVKALIPAGYELEVGDDVRIELAPERVLAAALIAYGIPLVGAVVGAGAGYLADLGDAGAAASALAGLAAGAVLGRARLRRDRSLRHLTPTIVAREVARQ